MDTFFHGCTPYGVRTFDHRHYVAASASGPRSTIPREYPFAHQVFAVKTYFPFWACQFPLPLEPGLQAPTCGRSALGDRPRGELLTRRCIPCMECNGMIYPSRHQQVLVHALDTVMERMAWLGAVPSSDSHAGWTRCRLIA